jgi:VIT1/CCC1 family predicted Fe2+/Mn2+ transporter
MAAIGLGSMHTSPTGSHHRNVQGGAARAAILGAGDGLLTNVSLVLGVAGASTNASSVRLAGVAGLLAGAFSMATGELVSVRAQDELVRREIESEREELKGNPHTERRELVAMLRSDGLPPDDAERVAEILSGHDRANLGAHVRMELGVDPDQTGRASQAAVTSFAAFTVGALLPLFPWFFIGGTTAVVLSIIIGGLAAVLLGAAIGRSTARSIWRTALRQLIATSIAAAITFSVGRAIGISVS